MHKFKILLLPIVLLLVSCEKEKPGPLPKTYNRTVIVYMAADNDLYSYVQDDINEMERGIVNGQNLIVFVDPYAGDPYVLEINHDNTDKIVSKKVKIYPKMNSATADVMKTVLEDLMINYKSNSYGLVLWSHGTGWMPQNTYGNPHSYSKKPELDRLVKSFAREGITEMEIADLAKALPAKFDFIIFDACLMGCVEIAYELRHKTDFLIFSAAEVLVGGFPYHTTIPHLFKPQADLVGACKSYMAHYKSMDGVMQSATISLFKTKEADNLALATKSIMQSAQNNLHTINVSNIQKYDRLNCTVFFDLKDFVEQLAPNANLSEFNTGLNATVLYEDHTESFLNSFLIRKSCGLSAYIPLQSNTLLNQYTTTSWYKAVYAE